MPDLGVHHEPSRAEVRPYPGLGPHLRRRGGPRHVGRAGGRELAAYVGHQNDADMQGLIRQYPAAAGPAWTTARPAIAAASRGTDTEREVSPCSYCHLLAFPNERYKTGVPRDYEATLNAYGLDYKKAGRAFEAFRRSPDRIPTATGTRTPPRSPICATRRCGQPSRPAPSADIVLGWDEIRKLPVHSQFLLMNKSTQRLDEYVTYKGVRVIDLLSAAKIYLTGVTASPCSRRMATAATTASRTSPLPSPRDSSMMRARPRRLRSGPPGEPQAVPPASRTDSGSPDAVAPPRPMNGTGSPSTSRPMRRRPEGSWAKGPSGWSCPRGTSWETGKDPASGPVRQRR